MASSSRSHQTLTIIPKEEEELEVEEEEDWLKLGLGPLGHGSSNPASSPSSQGPSTIITSHPQVVGLELGLGFEGGSSSGLGITKDDNNNDKGLLGISMVEVDHCNHYHNHHNHGIKLWPSSVPSCGDVSHHCPHQQCGLWFTLRSSTNRSGEALPQIPKAYIRVRDENMTVLMVKKYLVRKLGLSNEAEIDILCMGQSLSHIQTLKQVRDAVWLPRLVESLESTTLSLGDCSHDMSLNHIMSLLYRKHCFLN